MKAGLFIETPFLKHQLLYKEGIIPDSFLYGTPRAKNIRFITPEDDPEVRSSPLVHNLKGFAKLSSVDIVWTTDLLHSSLFKVWPGKPVVGLCVNAPRGHKRLLRLPLSMLDAYITLSSVQKKRLMEYGVPASKIHVVKFGSDLDFFHPQDVKTKGYALCWGTDQGRDYELVAEAARRHPDRVRVCSAEESIPPSARGRNVEVFPRYEYMYHLDLVRQRVAESEFCFIPVHKQRVGSRGSDLAGQMGITNALAMGKATLTAHREWQDEYFTEGKNILYYEADNRKDFFEMLEWAFDHPKAMRKMGENGRALVEKELNTKVFMEKCENILLSELE